MDNEFLLLDEVARKLRTSASSVNRLEADARNGIGNFPLSVQTKPRGKRRWLASQIDDYIASLVKANGVVPPPAKPKSEKQKAREFAERQQRAKAALARHGITKKGGTQS